MERKVALTGILILVLATLRSAKGRVAALVYFCTRAAGFVGDGRV